MKVVNSVKKRVIDKIIEVEGGYVNDPEDSGGETNYGITKRVAREYGYKGSMKDLPRSLAFEIYENRFWDSMLLDEVQKIAGDDIAEEIADTGVNTGVHRASEFLQRSLNVLNNKGKDYPDLKVDGDIGARTVSALKAFIAKRGSEGTSVLYRMLNSLQGAFYVTLAERREKDEKFVYGWFKNRVS